jgi:predicted phage terminase large subunit-like protein
LIPSPIRDDNHRVFPDLKNVDPNKQLLDLDRADYEESLYEFLKAAWRYMDPAPFKDGWHIAAIAEHLQAVVDGQLTRLIINVPPRHAKSSLIAVAFPAWVWAQSIDSHTSGPGVPFLFASYADKLSLRDSVKCRRLIESPFYQKYWRDRFTLTLDQNTKSRFTNDKGGERLITSIGAGVTGEGGNIIICDDPDAANDVASEATVQSTQDWWTQVMQTRTNDPILSAFIIIQQRLAENDLTGFILDRDEGEWTHLCLPARYEPERSCITTIGWNDPRVIPGELLWPERFTDASLTRLEKTMGPYAAAGQLQQRPEPQGGGIIKRDWWLLWERDSFPPMDFVLACLDTAYTEDTTNDPSGMIIWGVFSGDIIARSSQVIGRDGKRMPMDRIFAQGAPNAMLCYAWDDHLELHRLVKRVAETCVKMKVDLLLIENKASGISVAQEIRRLYSNEKFGVQLFDPKSQDKFARLYSVQHLFAEGLIWAPDRPWAEKVISQVGSFGGKPGPKHDEFVDLTSMGLRKLRDDGLLTRGVERLAELESQKQYRPNANAPLYPV